MNSPSHIVHVRCGAPRVAECADVAVQPCYVCAASTMRGLPVDDWAGASFTGQNRVRAPLAAIVCEACVFVMSRTSPVPGRPAQEGKKFGGNFRNYSHLWDECGGYANASKGEKSVIREFLERAHRGAWFAAIADSGQKHVLPWAPMNGPGRGGLVLFDEQLIEVPDEMSLVATMTALLTAGATKEELGSGDYSPRAHELCGAALLSFEDEHGPHRGGAWFRLALWLAQRDEEQVQRRIAAEKETRNAERERKGKVTVTDRRSASRGARRVSRDAAGERAEALGSATDANAERVADVCDTGGMGHEPIEAPPDRCAEPRQLTLLR